MDGCVPRKVLGESCGFSNECLNLRCREAAATAEGADECAGALELQLDLRRAVSMRFATPSTLAVASPFDGNDDVWFAFTAPSTDLYLFSTCGPHEADSTLVLYDANGQSSCCSLTMVGLSRLKC